MSATAVPSRQVTFLLGGSAKKVFGTLRAGKGIKGNFYRKP